MKRLISKNILPILFSLAGLAWPQAVHAQFLGYTSPQTVSQPIANNIACTPTIAVVVPNLGQTVHSVTFTVTGSEPALAFIQGSNDGVTFFQISDKAFSSIGSVTASGYYPVIKVQIACSLGATRVSANYAGTSVTLGQTFGDIDASYYNKTITVGGSVTAGSNFTSPLVTTPYGSLAGYLLFSYFGGSGPANSTINVQCSLATVASLPTFTLATPTTLQIFPMPNYPCENGVISYIAGGANANTIQISYLFSKPGSQSAITSAASLASTWNSGAIISERGSRWSQTSTPAAGTQATASRAAGSASTRHVADCANYSAGAIAAPAATALQINLRDGATGAGTVLWSLTIVAPASAGQHVNGHVCGLNLIGSLATAMTLEFSAALASESQSVTLTGYDVN